MSDTGMVPLGGPLQAFAAWLDATWLHDVVVNGPWMWPALETIHFLALGVMVGTIGVLDLRLIGLARRLPVAPLQQLVPWGVAAFAVNVVTGVMFVAGAPYQYFYNLAFQMKLLFIAAAGLNILIFYTRSARESFAVGAGEAVPLGGRIAGAVSLAAWIGVMYWGRMITFFRPPWVVPPQ
ncbi:MAG: hypothetical protein AB7P99_13920 [Vicinamibacterales bacterium]